MGLARHRRAAERPGAHRRRHRVGRPCRQCARRLAPRRCVIGRRVAPHHLYTQALLSAAPEPDPDAKRRRIVLEGDVPNPARVPPGCAFHTRCPIATERCRKERPELREVQPKQFAACHFAGPNPIPV
ncbi:MAG: hypothetical protein HYR63_12130 [Proteobacteria bacterium]|nr:hypothetical protein [Pseudomonadota bacterium]MBI3500036.1 hypothetical protein [Pseudomonadota bacterium]